MELVGVDVDERDLVEEAELHGEVAFKVCSIEVDASNGMSGGVAERGGADDAIVGAHVVTNPIASEVVRVGDDGSLPGMERRVGPPKQGIGDMAHGGGIGELADIGIRWDECDSWIIGFREEFN